MRPQGYPTRLQGAPQCCLRVDFVDILLDYYRRVIMLRATFMNECGQT
jgi:hypothetical protein